MLKFLFRRWPFAGYPIADDVFLVSNKWGDWVVDYHGKQVIINSIRADKTSEGRMIVRGIRSDRWLAPHNSETIPPEIKEEIMSLFIRHCERKHIEFTMENSEPTN